MFKLVDQSYNLGIHTPTTIDTKEKLYTIIKEHLLGLYEGKTKDEQLFWATVTTYVIEEDGIYLCSRIGTGCPIYNVKVVRSDKTKIEVIPYKVNGYNGYTIDKLEVYDSKRYTTVSPLDVMGWQEDLEQHWEGQIWVRTAFTGWNTIDVNVDLQAVFPNC